MAHGYPDWRQVAGSHITFQWATLDEMVARLGSIVTYDKRGDIVWYDDFENGLNKWNWDGGGADFARYLSRLRSRNGLFSCRLIGGKDSPGNVYISRDYYFTVLSKLGIEISYSVAGDFGSFNVEQRIWTGSRLLRGIIRWDVAASEWQYFNSGGTYSLIDTAPYPTTTTLFFHTIKLVMNPITEKYVRAIIDGSEYDLSDYAVSAGNSELPPQVRVYARLYSRNELNDDIYVDDAIATQNEP